MLPPTPLPPTQTVDRTKWITHTKWTTHTRIEREFFIDNLLVRIHFIIEMIWWTGLAPWEFEHVHTPYRRRGGTVGGQVFRGGDVGNPPLPSPK